jgi:flagellar basal body-associated protein FliL
MKKNSGGENEKNGLELDKIEIKGHAPNASSPKPAPQPSSPTAAEAPDHLEKKRTRLTLIVAPVALILLIFLIVLFKQQNFSFNFLTGETSTAENYLRVGPISATLANNDIINFSLDIDCRNEDFKEKLSGKDSQLRDKILSVITAPGTEELLENQQYEEVKAKIRESLGNITSEPIGDIYFAEIIVY